MQASLTLGNPDVIHGTGVAVAHFLRSITKKLALGAELAYQASPQLPGNHIAVVSFAARYASDEHTLAATLGNTGGLHATYYQKCGENLQVSKEYILYWTGTTCSVSSFRSELSWRRTSRCKSPVPQ